MAKPAPKVAPKAAPAPDAIDRFLGRTAAPPPPAPRPLPPPDAVVGNVDQGGQFQGLSHLADPGDVGAPPKTEDLAAKEKNTFDPNTDYSKLFDFFGIPSDVKQKIQDIIAGVKGDVSTGTPLALAYIRGTDWYAKTYTGIQYGVAAGLFGGNNPESDYRSYVDTANQYYRQYLTRDVTTDEIVNSLKEGVDTTIIGKRLEGQLNAKTYGNDWQALLGAFGDDGQASDSELQALGQQKAGLPTPIGDRFARQLDLAQQRMKGVLQGVLGTPRLATSNSGRLASSDLSGTKPSDVGA